MGIAPQQLMWETTENGMKFRDVVTPDGDAAAPESGQIVAIHYTATLVSDNNKVVESSGNRPFTFMLGDGSEPLFEEAIAGMKVGGTRRLNLYPGSKWAASNQTIQFELELVGIQTGLDALTFNLLRNRRSLVNAAILLSFAPD